QPLTFNAESLTFNSETELGPNRGVVGWIFPFAQLAIDSRPGGLFRERVACENRINSEAAIFRESEHSIVPPGKYAGRLRVKTQGVAQTNLAELLKRGALDIRAHDCAAPKLWIVNISIFRRDVEISTDRKIDIFLFSQAIPQSRVPFEFIFVSGRADGLTVRRVDRVNAGFSDRRRDHPCLRIDNFIKRRRAHVG